MFLCTEPLYSFPFYKCLQFILDHHGTLKLPMQARCVFMCLAAVSVVRNQAYSVVGGGLKCIIAFSWRIGFPITKQNMQNKIDLHYIFFRLGGSSIISATHHLTSKSNIIFYNKYIQINVILPSYISYLHTHMHVCCIFGR